jgi:hypothetical protein
MWHITDFAGFTVFLCNGTVETHSFLLRHTVKTNVEHSSKSAHFLSCNCTQRQRSWLRHCATNRKVAG